MPKAAVIEAALWHKSNAALWYETMPSRLSWLPCGTISSMTIEILAEDPREILVRHIIDGTMNATPEGIAIVGWLCDFHATNPAIEDIIGTSDGWLMARHTGEVEAEFLGPRDGFYAQIRLVCKNCGLTDVQTDVVEGIARSKVITP